MVPPPDWLPVALMMPNLPVRPLAGNSDGHARNLAIVQARRNARRWPTWQRSSSPAAGRTIGKT